MLQRVSRTITPAVGKRLIRHRSQIFGGDHSQRRIDTDAVLQLQLRLRRMRPGHGAEGAVGQDDATQVVSQRATHDSGRYSAASSPTTSCDVVICKVTATWQLAPAPCHPTAARSLPAVARDTTDKRVPWSTARATANSNVNYRPRSRVASTTPPSFIRKAFSSPRATTLAKARCGSGRWTKTLRWLK